MIQKVIDGAYQDMATRLTVCHAELMKARIGLGRAASVLDPLDGYRDDREDIVLAGHALRKLEKDLSGKVALIEEAQDTLAKKRKSEPGAV